MVGRAKVAWLSPPFILFVKPERFLLPRNSLAVNRPVDVEPDFTAKLRGQATRNATARPLLGQLNRLQRS